MKFVLLFVVAMAALMTTAAADLTCGPRAAVLDVITGPRYGERLSSIGLGSTGVVVEVWGNSVTGSFSITHTNTLGWTCIVYSGNGWERRPFSPTIERDS